MANIRSQKKRNRQNKAQSERNRSMRSELKTRMRSAAAVVESGDEDAAAEQFRLAQKQIDKAVAKGLIHKNTGSRRKTKLAKQARGLNG